MTTILVDDVALDLFPDTVVSVTVQKIDVAELKTRYVSRTNQFKVPRTSRNELVFGISADYRIQTSVPYVAIPARITQNGFDMISDAKARVVSCTDEDYTIQIIENLADFFAAIRGTYINSVNPIADSAWDAAGIDTARTNTSGIVSAVMHWGKSGSLYQVNYFLPCFFYHTFITKILQSTGLTLSGSILTNSDFTDLVIPYPNEKFKYDEASANTYYDKGSVTSGGGIGGSQWSLGYNNLSVVGTTGRWSSGIYYPSSVFSSVSLTFTGTFSFTSIVWSAGTTNGRYWMELLKNGTTSVASTDGLGGGNITYANTSGTITASFTGISALSTDFFIWRIRATATGGTLTANSAVVTASNCEVVCSTTINRTSVKWSALWDQIDCAKLIEDFFNRFGIIPKQVGTVLYLKTIQEMISDTSGAVDWSAKRASDQFTMSFQTGYAQQNTFKYSDSDYAEQTDLGQGILAISNAIDKVRDLFSSVFEKCRTVQDYFYSYGNVAQIPVYGTTSTGIDTFENKPSLSLLTLRSNTSGTSITFNTIARNDFKVAYFVDSTQTKDTSFSYFVGRYYQLFDGALEKNRIISRKYLLTEQDVAQFDPHKLIYDDGYFIVNKITNFVPNQLTQVELFKVG